MKITLINTSIFVLIGRNENNSAFYIKPKVNFEREIILENSENSVISTIEGIKSESAIVEMIQSGIEFYTYNKELETFTKVIVVDGHVKTVANETETDNIVKLPILSIL